MDTSMAPREVVSRPVRFGMAELIPVPEKPNAWRLAVDGVLQSYVDLDDPRVLEMHYSVWVGKLLDLHWPQGTPISAVHVGGGGMTLPRYLAATRPGSAQTVFELDDQLVEFVREHLGLTGVRDIRLQDGRAGAVELPEATADVIMLDAYAGGDGSPETATVEYLRRLAKVLRAGGLCVVNVWDDGGLGFALRAAASMAATFPNALTFAQGVVLMRQRAGNVVLAGSSADLPVAALAEWAPSAGRPAFCLTPAQLAAVCGPATPLTADDPLTAPMPAVTRFRRT